MLYQPTLRPPPSFYESYGLDAELVRFVDCHPDMIEAYEVDGSFELRVLDAKASDMMKLAHRIQVALYSIMLDHVLRDEGIAATGSRVGGVWLYEHDEPEWFDLSRVRAPLETFLAHELTPILEAPASEAFWHLYYRCEWCDYYAHCRQEAEATDDVSLVPYLSTFAKRHLHDVADVSSVADLGRLLDADDAEEKLTGCASLEGRHEPLQRTVRALLDDETRPTGNVSVAMPKGEQIRIVLTVQSEPLSGSMYGYAINRVFGKDLFPEWRESMARVAADPKPETLDELRRDLVRDLMDILRTVHAHNTAHVDDWSAQKGVQVYVFDGYERTILVENLLLATSDPVVQEEALALLFYFQHPDLALADDHPADEVFFPVIVLTSVIRQLFAMPVPVVYRFAEVAAQLQPSRYGFQYEHDDYYGFALSNRMRSDPILTVWNRDRTDLIGNIENELERRVWGANSIVDGVKERLEGTGALFAWPPKFFLPPGLGFTNPLLSRLAFITKYEVVLGYLNAITRRSAPESERVKMRDAARLRFVGDDRFVPDPVDQELDIAATGFKSWVLTTDTDDGQRARVTFDDFLYRDRMYPPKNRDLALAAVRRIDDDGTFHLELQEGQDFRRPTDGEICFLDGRFTDFISKRLIDDLSALDADADPWYARLVDDPLATRSEPSIRDEIAGIAVELAEAHGMTASQLEAFDGVIDNDVQLVWGPPGTGKTHFLALSMLCLAEAHRRAGEPLRVLLTAFTNAAIDNCLHKLVELSEEHRIYDGDLPVRRAGRAGASSSFDVVDRDALASVLGSESINITGSTVWQLYKTDPEDLCFDLVVIDEGSQLKTGEAAMPVRRLRRGGRLVIAGDDKQLAPIVQGRYPTDDEEPRLHRSILECLRERTPSDELTTPLLENFRMCDVLCEYPRTSIYPADYRPFSDEVAQRRLAEGDPTGSELLDLLLDPAAPLVVCALDGIKATAENVVEARLVADATIALYERLGRPDDEEFWRDRLFIVSPHHAQIRQIRRELADRHAWDAPPFVDTVDALQGQECDAVIVSYGVSDVEYALSEREFIYSLNRLNVSVTRARMKTIVFLSRQLLEPPIQALDQDDVADGIAYMQGLARFCELHGPPRSIDLGEGITARVVRAGGGASR